MSYASDALIDAQEREIKKLKAENDKLRELMCVVYGYYASGTISPCDICDSIGCQYVGEAESGCRYHDCFDRAEAAEDEIRRQMRDIGIEVE